MLTLSGVFILFFSFSNYVLIVHRLEKEIKNYKNTVEANNREIAQLKEHVTQLEALIEQYQSRNIELEDRCKVVDELKENLKKQLEKNNVSINIVCL